MPFLTERPHPSRRRGLMLSSFSILLVLLSLLSSTIAYDMEVDSRAYNSRQFKKLEKLGQIHIDPRPPPRASAWIARRQAASTSGSSTILVETSTSDVPSSPSTTETSSTGIGSSSSPSSTFSSSPASHSASSTTSAATKPSTSIITTPIPVPFDTSLGSNFTAQSCPDFFATFLANSTFKSCTPISLLLQNSNSFFQAERDATLLTETLDIACDVPLAICSPLMTSIASQLISDSNCGADYSLQNPLVMQAHAGLVAYEPLFRATCLKNQSTGSYCFSDAITNSSAPADSYPYYTALGLNMPTSSRPSCTKCLQNTMNVFASYASDSTQPLAATYQATAYQIDLGCGPTFVNTTVPVATGMALSGRGQAGVVAVASAALAALAILI